MGLFGRKKSNPVDDRAGQTQTEHQPGHAAVLRHLNEIEQSEPEARERLAGAVIFDLALQILNVDRRVRLEDLFAMLASVGGQQCIAPIVQAAPANTNFDTLDLMAVQGNDGRLYLFGDPPNRLLLESEDSLLSLAFGAAQTWGAPVTMTMIYEEMKNVASRIGGPEFDVLDLPREHMVDKPTEWARSFNAKILEALDQYQVPPMRRATAIGYAIQRAFEMSKKTLDPFVAAKIVLQCACRTSKTLIS